MVTLYENIVKLCEARGIKGGKMCTDLKISKGLLSDLKYGRRTGVSAETAQKIAAYFNVTVGYLLGKEDAKKEPAANLSDKLPSDFYLLSDEQKKQVTDYIAFLLSQQ